MINQSNSVEEQKDKGNVPSAKQHFKGDKANIKVTGVESTSFDTTSNKLLANTHIEKVSKLDSNKLNLDEDVASI